MSLSIHDLLWAVPALVGLLNAWQNKSIGEAILALKIELADRIARCEGDIKELRGRCQATHGPHDSGDGRAMGFAGIKKKK